MTGFAIADIFRRALSAAADGFAADTADELDLVARFGDVVADGLRVKTAPGGGVVSSSLFTHSVDADSGERVTVIYTLVGVDDRVLGGELLPRDAAPAGAQDYAPAPAASGVRVRTPEPAVAFDNVDDGLDWLGSDEGRLGEVVESVTEIVDVAVLAVEPDPVVGRGRVWDDDLERGWQPWRPW